MKPIRSPFALITMTALAAASGLAVHDAGAQATAIDQHQPADLNGALEITSLSGRIEIVGWEKPEIAVTGTLGPDSDKVDLAVSGHRATLRVISKDAKTGSRASHWGLHDDASATQLTVRVPRATSLTASLVSADLVTRDLAGEQDLRTVSGAVTTTVQRAAHVHTVSGDIDLTAGADSTLLELGSVSGGIHITGGSGEVSADTISGDGNFSLGLVNRASFKTVSGQDHVTLALSADGKLEAESVSGDITVDFVGKVPAAQFHLESFSGDLRSCFGPKESHEQYGPGSHIQYTEGAGTGRVHIVSKSGDIRLCTKP